ncbi:BRO1-like domain-containing protein [Phyllosticta citribraziliensis]|uniref:BRO1-like domain-containing protein n=1 Tax=Phyllosticta citribraziliensis TaxID=989973 RepID=A0ABR1M3Z2_9PEZI
MLHLPFRRSHGVTLSDSIKQYISSKYDQHPDMFAADLEAIDSLRSSAINSIEPHASGVRKLQAYAAQLVWIGGKFPVDIGVEFMWYPALGYNTQRPISENNIRFELANIVFNLAAMYSQLATSTNRTTSDGLKLACNYFCVSAGVLSHLKTTIIPDLRTAPPEDMDTMTLESLEHLMLAQAQECFWQKAVKDGLKDASISKLAAKVSDLYVAAGDWGIKSNAVSSEWIHHTTAKHHHFAAAAQFRAALDCLEKRKYGEEVARLRDSLNCANEALKEARYISKAVLGDLNGLKNRVSEDLKRAEKDNDMIYLLPVPPKSELKTLDRAGMVAAKIPKEISDPLSMLGDNGELGRPLFSKLVPYSVHVAASIYADRRDRLVNKTIDELEDLTARIHEVLKSLNLPGSLQALEKPLGLPPGLVSHAEEIRQQGGLDRIYRSIDETEGLKDSDRAVYQEGVDLLRSEAAEDERARRKYGTDRWLRALSTEAAKKLYAQISEIEGYLSSAANSDGIVQGKVKENESLIRLLSGTDRDLESFVPSSRRVSMTAEVEREASKLRGCLNEVARLESRRKKKIEALKAKAKQDDITPSLLSETARLERAYPMQPIEAIQFEDLFSAHLSENWDPETSELLSSESQLQSTLVSRLTAANAAFNAARAPSTNKSSSDREAALQKLENAYFKYKEVISNLDVGRKFYNDLAKVVGRFREDARAFTYGRRAEAASFERDIVEGMEGLVIREEGRRREEQLKGERERQVRASMLAGQPVPSAFDVNAGSPQQQQPQQHPQPLGSGNATPLPAPTPTRASFVEGVQAGAAGPSTNGMWSPEVGIRFGGPPGGAAAAAPQQQQPPGPDVQNRTWDPSMGLKFG